MERATYFSEGLALSIDRASIQKGLEFKLYLAKCLLDFQENAQRVESERLIFNVELDKSVELIVHPAWPIERSVAQVAPAGQEDMIVENDLTNQPFRLASAAIVPSEDQAGNVVGLRLIGKSYINDDELSYEIFELDPLAAHDIFSTRVSKDGTSTPHYKSGRHLKISNSVVNITLY